MPLSESASICFDIDFADIPTSGRLIQFVFSGYFILLATFVLTAKRKDLKIRRVLVTIPPVTFGYKDKYL